MTVCFVGELLKGEVLGSRRINNLIIELVKTHKGKVGIDVLQTVNLGSRTDKSTGWVVTLFSVDLYYHRLRKLLQDDYTTDKSICFVIIHV